MIDVKRKLTNLFSRSIVTCFNINAYKLKTTKLDAQRHNVRLTTTEIQMNVYN